MRTAAVASEQGERCAQATAGTASLDRDAVGVDPELVGVLGHPHQAGVHVLERSRERGLGREAITHRDQDGTEPTGKPEVGAMFGLEVSEDEPAAVHVVNRGRGTQLCGPIDTDRHIRVTWPARHYAVLDPHTDRVFGSCGRHHFHETFAHRGHVVGVHRGQ